MAGKRGRQTVRGMVQSLGVIMVAAGVMYLFIPHDENADPVKAKDYRVELLTAQRAAPYPVLAPEGLGEGWKATVVSYKRENGNAWQLGFLSPDTQYVAIHQSTTEPGKFVPQVTQKAKDTGKTETVSGQVWQRWEGPKYDALVRTEGGATTVVTGTASFEQLAEMAGRLQSRKA
ncbi:MULTISPECIES: DUF4245 domain-containing protein [unclassified Streptomyces]|uniref:DUF4245 domain-containing protein n=1 Tax=unclassified Streptomyces TaxID=2593676 RepID=UPI0016602350|nr:MULTISPECIES: DUF4245 domain-containing protein [unclassified Streptomyces]MBD0706898.1 hypothetical protein [Streptomyces sp. CBMA291]MBD0715034.1 hypothetical protein [Streptomyces sp. CBMA370]